MYPVPAEYLGNSSSQVTVSLAGFSIIDRSQLSPVGAVRPARTTYFATKANAKRAIMLRNNFLLSKAANRLFHSDQAKQNETTQKGSPVSGRTELKTCTVAANSDNIRTPFDMLCEIG